VHHDFLFHYRPLAPLDLMTIRAHFPLQSIFSLQAVQVVIQTVHQGQGVFVEEMENVTISAILGTFLPLHSLVKVSRSLFESVVLN
jgi:hypothetical protein